MALRAIREMQKRQADEITGQLQDNEKDFMAKFSKFKRRVNTQKKSSELKTHQFQWNEEARNLHTQQTELEAGLLATLSDLEIADRTRRGDEFTMTISAQIKAQSRDEDLLMQYKRGLRADLARPKAILRALSSQRNVGDKNEKCSES